MSVNKERPHFLVLPEDDANRQLARGFQLGLVAATRQMQPLPEAGGWSVAVDLFLRDHCVEMKRYPKRCMILLIDFDKQKNRLEEVKNRIPEDLRERVFVLGTWTEPEDLRKKLRLTLEQIGQDLAAECRDNTTSTWGCDLLGHNAAELNRLREQFRTLFFPD